MNSSVCIESIDQLRSLLDTERASGKSVGFVPTMGYLHAGHESLLTKAAQENDVSVMSIFVNPLQFAPSEDLSTYPSDKEQDIKKATACGIQYVFAPSVAEMYPDYTSSDAVLTSITVQDLSTRWEGASRPTHFSGVSTVVAKLFTIVGACTAYFGEKDFQQLAIVKRLVRDLSFPVNVVGCPLIREPDGLALSSRNVYLSEEERQASLILKKTVDYGASLIKSGAKDPIEVIQKMEDHVLTQPLAQLDYVTVVEPTTLEVPDSINQAVRLLIAARFGTTRLIDNLLATE